MLYNATWVKSGGTIITGGLLTLIVDYGFPNKIVTSSLSDKQLLKYDATNTKWINANAKFKNIDYIHIDITVNKQENIKRCL